MFASTARWGPARVEMSFQHFFLLLQQRAVTLNGRRNSLPPAIGMSLQLLELPQQMSDIQRLDRLAEPAEPDILHQDVVLLRIADGEGRTRELERADDVVEAGRDHQIRPRDLMHQVMQRVARLR